MGDQTIHEALLDPGSGVNLLPYLVYERLGLRELKPTGMILQLTDRSTGYLRGIIDNAFIKVGEFIFPKDFVVLKTELVLNPNA